MGSQTMLLGTAGTRSTAGPRKRMLASGAATGQRSGMALDERAAQSTEVGAQQHADSTRAVGPRLEGRQREAGQLVARTHGT